MNKITIQIIAVLIFYCQANSATTLSLTQHGITWIFASPTEYGQFVNGDYWVVDPGTGVSITEISPGYSSSPRAINGSMINPSTTMQGYDGYQNYDAEKNVGTGITPSTPLVLSGDVSLVSTTSNLSPGMQEGGEHLSFVNSAAVLTCLTSAPPTGSFRPGISSTTKTLHNSSDIDWSKLAILPYINKHDIEGYADLLDMVWLTHGTVVDVRYMHPSASGLSNYTYALIFSQAAELLNMDYSNAEKEHLLINYIQLGIDIYSYIESGANGWTPDGGQASGRKWP